MHDLYVSCNIAATMLHQSVCFFITLLCFSSLLLVPQLHINSTSKETRVDNSIKHVPTVYITHGVLYHIIIPFISHQPGIFPLSLQKSCFRMHWACFRTWRVNQFPRQHWGFSYLSFSSDVIKSMCGTILYWVWVCFSILSFIQH